MNLLSLLLRSLLTGGSISALSGKTGLSSDKLKKLIPLAIPLLLKFLTSNASSESGLSSLLNALTQHTNKKPLAEQIEEADCEDGKKIIGHIFGGQSDAVVNNLAEQSGLSETEVNSALSGLAPALMSSLSAATQSASSAPKVDLSDGLDLSDLAAMFAGSKPQSSAGGLLSGLLGGVSGDGLGGDLFGSILGSSDHQAENDSTVNGTHLLNLLSSLRRS